MNDCNLHNRIKYNLAISILILGMFGCTPPKYIVKKQSELITLDLDNAIVNFIPIPDNELQKSNLLDSSYHLLIDKKYPKLEKYINSKESSGMDTPDLFLSKTLLSITKKEYSDAFQSLTKIHDSDYSMLKKLLILDLNYEMARMNGNFDYNIFLKDYQSLIDSYPDDLTLKKIVLIRLRYLRYNY